jgi:hypothetical protein
VLAAEDVRDLRGQTPEDQAFGVDDMPGALDVGGFGGEGAHARALSAAAVP